MEAEVYGRHLVGLGGQASSSIDQAGTWETRHDEVKEGLVGRKWHTSRSDATSKRSGREMDSLGHVATALDRHQSAMLSR